jgi:hypothetical protein
MLWAAVTAVLVAQVVVYFLWIVHMSTVQWRSPRTATIPRPEPVHGRGEGSPNAEIGNLLHAMPTTYPRHDLCDCVCVLIALGKHKGLRSALICTAGTRVWAAGEQNINHGNHTELRARSYQLIITRRIGR